MMSWEAQMPLADAQAIIVGWLREHPMDPNA